MKITNEILKEKGACSEGVEWFSLKFPTGEEYQNVLNALAEDDKDTWAIWLLHSMGKTTDIFKADEINTEKSFFFSGSVIVRGNIKCRSIKAGLGIKAGEGIEAGWGIEAGEGIEAGRGIEAGEGIKAGDDFEIFAGLSVRLSQKSELAIVTAETKPKNLASGYWVSKEKK